MSERIPHALIEQIKEGNVVLFLGAGAAFDAFHPEDKKPPTGNQLSNLIAKKFLGDDYLNQDLQYVSELAISESNLFEVQKFVADIFTDFKAGEHHLLMPEFHWNTIFTTNYDRIIEDAYNRSKNKKQELAVFIKDGERVNEKMTNPDSLMLVKLHGSITDISDEKVPLILTPDQYVDHKENRKRLFNRLEDISYESPIVFIGFSFKDSDIRMNLKHLESMGDRRPRSYMVGPGVTEAEQRMWGQKKITALRMRTAMINPASLRSPIAIDTSAAMPKI